MQALFVRVDCTGVRDTRFFVDSLQVSLVLLQASHEEAHVDFEVEIEFLELFLDAFWQVVIGIAV